MMSLAQAWSDSGAQWWTLAVVVIVLIVAKMVLRSFLMVVLFAAMWLGTAVLLSQTVDLSEDGVSEAIENVSDDIKERLE